jgi:hypothetical protein
MQRRMNLAIKFRSHSAFRSAVLRGGRGIVSSGRRSPLCALSGAAGQRERAGVRGRVDRLHIPLRASGAPMYWSARSRRSGGGVFRASRDLQAFERRTGCRLSTPASTSVASRSSNPADATGVHFHGQDVSLRRTFCSGIRPASDPGAQDTRDDKRIDSPRAAIAVAWTPPPQIFLELLISSSRTSLLHCAHHHRAACRFADHSLRHQRRPYYTIF